MSKLIPIPRKRRKSVRARHRRAHTIPVAKKLSEQDRRLGEMMYPPTGEPRPVRRDQCQGEERPCPWVGCKFHLYLDVNPETGSIKINFPDKDPWELEHSCSLDVAAEGGATLEEVGEIMNLTRERIRQVEITGILKLKMVMPDPDEDVSPVSAALWRRPGH